MHCDVWHPERRHRLDHPFIERASRDVVDDVCSGRHRRRRHTRACRVDREHNPLAPAATAATCCSSRRAGRCGRVVLPGVPYGTNHRQQSTHLLVLSDALSARSSGFGAEIDHIRSRLDERLRLGHCRVHVCVQRTASI